MNRKCHSRALICLQLGAFILVFGACSALAADDFLSIYNDLVKARSPTVRAELIPKELTIVSWLTERALQSAEYYTKKEHDYRKALERADLALELVVRLDDPKMCSLAWRRRAKALEGLVLFAEAASAYTNAITFARRADDEVTAAALTIDLGSTFFRQANYSRAINQYQHGLALIRSQPPTAKARRVEAIALYQLGETYRRKSDFDQARRILEECLNIETELTNSIGIADTELSLANIHHAQGRFDAAEALYLKALPVYQATNDLGGIAQTFHNLGTIYDKRRQVALALTNYSQALELYRRLKQPREELDTLNNLGALELASGKVFEAMPRFEQSLRLAERLQDFIGAARATHNLGQTHYKLGDYATALRFLFQSLDLYRALSNEVEIAETRAAIANIYWVADQLDEAVSEYLAAQTLFARLGLPIQEALTLHNLATVYLSMSDRTTDGQRQQFRQQAREAFLKSLQLKRQTADPAGECDTLNNLAALELLDGRVDDAAKLFAEALDLARRAQLSEDEARALHGLGNVARARGHLDEAATHYREALRCHGTNHGAEASDLIDLHVGQGQIAHARHLWREAEFEYLAAIDQVEQRRVRFTDPAHRAGFFSRHTLPYFLLACCYLDQHRSAAAWQTAERTKARTLVELLQSAPTQFEPELTPAERHKLEDLDNRVTFARLELESTRARGGTADLRPRLDEARREADLFRQQLAASLPRRALGQGQFPLASPDSLQTLFAGRRLAVLEFFVADEGTLLFALTGPTNLIARRLLVTRARLSRLVRNYHERIAKTAGDPSPDSQGDREIRELHQLLLEPTQEFLTNVEILCVVPDGVLWELPFAALRRRTGRYLIEDCALFYAPSLSALLAMRQLADVRPSSPRPDNSKPDILVMADPDLGSTSQVTAPWLGGFAAIPGTRLQAEALQSLLAQRASVFVGKEASEERLRRSTNYLRVLHLASHGHFDPSPLRSGVWLTRGANDDGLWTVLDILQRRLSAELVVLPACETARGAARPGEGMIGLSWALAAAGCRTSVLTQWAVADHSTARVMVDFYRRWLARNSRPDRSFAVAEALREAQLEMLRTRGSARPFDHPFHWAPFVVFGDSH